MTKPLDASSRGLKPYYKIRIYFGSVYINAASWSIPLVARNETGGIQYVHADWIDDPDYADTVDFVDWSEVTGISHRYAA